VDAVRLAEKLTCCTQSRAAAASIGLPVPGLRRDSNSHCRPTASPTTSVSGRIRGWPALPMPKRFLGSNRELGKPCGLPGQGGRGEHRCTLRHRLPRPRTPVLPVPESRVGRGSTPTACESVVVVCVDAVRLAEKLTNCTQSRPSTASIGCRCRRRRRDSKSHCRPTALPWRPARLQLPLPVYQLPLPAYLHHKLPSFQVYRLPSGIGAKSPNSVQRVLRPMSSAMDPQREIFDRLPDVDADLRHPTVAVHYACKRIRPGDLVEMPRQD
jgi:hypothetical protein